MKRVGFALLMAFAVFGLFAAISIAVQAVQSHYAVQCADDDADNYGFTIPHVDTGFRRSAGVQGGT